MAFLFSGLFGGESTMDTTQLFDMKAINKSVYEQTTINKNISLASQTNIQTMDITMRNVFACKSTFKQGINASASSSSTLNSDQETAIKNAITTEMLASVDAQMEKVTEAFNMQSGDEQNLTQNLKYAVENIIENTVIIENINKAIAEQMSIQDQLIIIDGYDCSEGGSIDFEQDITAQLAADIITTNLSSAVADNTLLNKFKADVKASQRTENKGIADIIDSVFDGITGPMKYAMIASVVCCMAIVVLVIVMGLSPGGQKSMGTLSKAGAARMGRKF
jgi:hypothetical protein